MYFDNAATSFPKPDCVADAVSTYLREIGAAAGRGGYDLATQADRVVSQCRSQVASLVGAHEPNSIVFTHNCTDSLNTVLFGLLNHGDRVVASELEHNSVLRPLEQLRSRNNIEFELISFAPDTGLVDPRELDNALNKIPARLVAINHASNVTGIVQPVKEIIAIAHRHGALVLLDAAQTAGHLPIDVMELDVDFLATAGHKGLLGPLGTGVLYIRPGLETVIAPLRCGGTGTLSESLTQPHEMPWRFESGNANMPGISGLKASTEWLIERGVASIHERTTATISLLKEGLSNIDGVTVYCPSALTSTGVVSFNISGVDCREAAVILDQTFNIQCRAGLHCAPLVHKVLNTLEGGGTLRFSPGYFTTDDEIEAGLESVEQLAAGFAA